jgi:uncharacterized protein (DUF4415 family)
MNAKRSGSARISPEADTLPEITEAWISGAELRRADTLVRRGRPKLDDPRKLLSLRLPPSVISKWKASGPGWQTRMAKVLENSAPKGRRTAG